MFDAFGVGSGHWQRGDGIPFAPVPIRQLGIANPDLICCVSRMSLRDG